MPQELSYYLFNNIPGAHPSWTLAVLATSKIDAVNYIKLVHRGGIFISKSITQKVNADCGAVTENATLIIRHNNEIG